MKRLHLFEWEDQSWLPKVFRDFITDHLHHVMTRGRVFIPVAPLLHKTLQSIGESRIVDLCSGGGGPYPGIVNELNEKHGMNVEATLTDLFPNRAAITRIESECNGKVVYRNEPTDIFKIPDELDGMRTIFTALHHFRPETVRELLKSVAAGRKAIGAFEAQRRDLKTMIKIMLFNIISSFLVTHRVGRMTFGRAIFTYLIPIAPLIYMWDGMVSCLRTYTPDDLRLLTEGIEGYTWNIGELEGNNQLGPYKITYLIGVPTNAEKR